MPKYKAEEVKYLIDKACELWGKTRTDFSERETVFFKALTAFVNEEAAKNYKQIYGQRHEKNAPQIGSYQTLMNYEQTVNNKANDEITASNRIIDTLKFCIDEQHIMPTITKGKKPTANDLRGNWTVLMRKPNDAKGFSTIAEGKPIEIKNIFNKKGKGERKLHLILTIKNKPYKAPINKRKDEESYLIDINSREVQMTISLDFTQQRQNIIFIGQYNARRLPVYNRPLNGEIFLIRTDAVETYFDSKQQLSLPILAAALAYNPNTINSLTEVYHDFNGSKAETVFLPNPTAVNSAVNKFSKSLNIVLGSLLLILGIWIFSNKNNNNESSPISAYQDEAPKKGSNEPFNESMNSMIEDTSLSQLSNSISDKVTYETIIDSQLIVQKDSIINSLTTALTQSNSICLSDSCINSYFLERELKQPYKYRDIPKAGSQTSLLKLYEEKKYVAIIERLEQRPAANTDALRILALAKFYTQDFNGANSIFEDARRPIGSLDDNAIEWFAILNGYILELQKGRFDYNRLQSLKTKFQPIINNNNHPYTKQAAEITKQLDCILARR